MTKMSSTTLIFLLLSVLVIHHIPAVKGATWCVVNLRGTDQQWQANINFACSSGINCAPIRPGGSCYEPNTLRNHASYAMNSYYQTHGRTFAACDFGGTGTIAATDPSFGRCVYPH